MRQRELLRVQAELDQLRQYAAVQEQKRIQAEAAQAQSQANQYYGELQRQRQLQQYEAELLNTQAMLDEAARQDAYRQQERLYFEQQREAELLNREIILNQRAAAAGSTAGDAFESKIDGDFEGWNGETIVALVNGQIWRQTDYHYEYGYAFMPEVIVYNPGGGWRMQVEGWDRAIRVERLR